jgi:hypothetical protein
LNIAEECLAQSYGIHFPQGLSEFTPLYFSYQTFYKAQYLLLSSHFICFSFLYCRKYLSIPILIINQDFIKMATDNNSVAAAAVPVMDFEAIRGSTGDERKGYLHQLDKAWSNQGAIYVINHSVGTDLVNEALEWVS